MECINLEEPPALGGLFGALVFGTFEDVINVEEHLLSSLGSINCIMQSTLLVVRHQWQSFFVI